MARLWTSGAESGAALTDGITVSGAVTWDTGTFRGGARAWRFAASASAANAAIASSGALSTWTPTLNRNYYSRLYLNLAANPTADARCLAFRQSGGTYIVSVRITTTGHLAVYNETTAALLNADIGALGTGWHRLETRLLVNTSTTGEFEVLLDGVQLYVGTALNLGATAPGQMEFGWSTAPSGSTAHLYVDDAALNDNQGADENSWPGDGKVINLRPISDNARGTNWFEGTSATTNLWHALDNVPPVGKVDPQTNGTLFNIRNAVSDALGNYDANVQSYTTGGVGANDTIALVRWIIAAGVSSLTSTNTGAGRIVSNPAEGAETTYDAEAAATAGTFPTGWIARGGPVNYNPSVTKGTSPVARIGKRTAATRVQLACYMVVLVEYFTPAATRTVTTSLVASDPDQTRTVTTSVVANTPNLVRTVTSSVVAYNADRTRTVTTSLVASSDAASPPTFRTAANAASKTCNKPTGTLEGDTLIAYVLDEGNHTITPPDGSWTQIDNILVSSAIRHASFWKRAGASEPSTYTWTITGSTYTEILIEAWPGVDVAAPINAHNTGNADGTSGPAVPNVTTTVQNCGLSISVNEWFGNAWATADISGSVYTLDTGISTSSAWDMGAFNRTVTGATTYGGETVTWVATGGGNYHSILVVALKPAAGGAGGGTRTVPTSAVALATSVRTVPTSVVALATSVRTVTSSLVASAINKTRTVTTSLVASVARPEPSFALLRETKLNGDSATGDGGAPDYWGFHKARVVQAPNGDVYTTLRTSGTHFKVYKRAHLTGTWSVALDISDSNIINDPETINIVALTDGSIHCFAWKQGGPPSVVTHYYSTNNGSSWSTESVGSSWTQGRGYLGAGVDTDDHLVLLACRNSNDAALNLAARDPSDGSWVTRTITWDYRYSYSFMLPNAANNLVDWPSSRDVDEVTLGVPGGNSSTYVENKGETFDNIDAVSLAGTANRLLVKSESDPTSHYTGGSMNQLVQLNDAYRDTDGRLHILYFDSVYASFNDRSRHAIIESGAVTSDAPIGQYLGGSSAYNCRIIQDAPGRFYLLTIDDGHGLTCVPATDTDSNGTDWDSGSAVTLTPGHAITGWAGPSIACPRTGSALGNAIEISWSTTTVVGGDPSGEGRMVARLTLNVNGAEIPSGGGERTVTTSVVALQTSTRTVSSSAVALKTNTRTVSSSIVALETRVRTVSTSLVALAVKTRTISSSVVALATAIRTVTTGVVARETRTRTVPTSIVASGSPVRTVSTSVVALKTSTRTVTTSLVAMANRTVATSVVALQSTTRTVQTSLVTSGGATPRTVTTSVVALQTATRVVATSVAAATLGVTRTVATSIVTGLIDRVRTVATSLVTSGSPVRQVTTSVVAKATSVRTVATSLVVQQNNITRTVPTSLTASTAQTRTVTTSIAALSTRVRTVPTSITCSGSPVRSVPSSVVAKALNIARTVPTSIVATIPGTIVLGTVSGYDIGIHTLTAYDTPLTSVSSVEQSLATVSGKDYIP